MDSCRAMAGQARIWIKMMIRIRKLMSLTHNIKINNCFKSVRDK